MDRITPTDSPTYRNDGDHHTVNTDSHRTCIVRGCSIHSLFTRIRFEEGLRGSPLHSRWCRLRSRYPLSTAHKSSIGPLEALGYTYGFCTFVEKTTMDMFHFGCRCSSCLELPSPSFSGSSVFRGDTGPPRGDIRPNACDDHHVDNW